MTHVQRNRLADETSPYLLQHAENPVYWHPWGEEALTEARERDKPILLSIGYSACHWCHVMARESFAHQPTAALMNEHFVNIKVDREERPDIDRIYQTAHQILSQQAGGWPLTVFLEPHTQRPFFSGTYFPRDEGHGQPGFAGLLLRIAEFFRENRNQLRDQTTELIEVFAQLVPEGARKDFTLTREPLELARQTIGDSVDREFGGVGSAPKFFHTTSLERLLRDWRASANASDPDVEALFLVSLTLSRMAEGGVCDQLGGGFFRYAVDRHWQIPHFEKMLYDQGPLLALYAQLYLATGEPLFGRVAREIAGCLLNDLAADDGGFCASRDADSGGGEGHFYSWTPEAVRALLHEDAYDLIAQHYGLDQPANFEDRWHLTVRTTVPDLAAETGDDADEIEAIVERCKTTMVAARGRRTPPERDDKRLTAWNALAVRGLAIAGRALDDDRMLDAAAAAIDFIANKLKPEGRLFACYAAGRSRFDGYLDDYAFLLDALLELLQARWRTDYLRLATTLADALLEHFEDHEHGGFFFTAHDTETLMVRQKPIADVDLPSGNGIAALALQRLGLLLGETRYLEAAERALRFAWQAMLDYPHGHASLITALEEHLEPPEIVVLRGAEEDIRGWQRSADRLYAPRRLMFAIPASVDELPGALAERQAVAGQTLAYQCIGTQCSAPLTSWEALAAALVR